MLGGPTLLLLPLVLAVVQGGSAGGGAGSCGLHYSGNEQGSAPVFKPVDMVFVHPYENNDNQWKVVSQRLPNTTRRAAVFASDVCKDTLGPGIVEDKDVRILYGCRPVNETLPCRSWCHDPESFLGVGNPICIGRNVVTSGVLLFGIVFSSLIFTVVNEKVKNACRGKPQLEALHEHLVQEITILGFISMLVFVLSFTGSIDTLARYDSTLGAEELFHFKEFFHFIIFLTMVCYIGTVGLLLWISGKLPLLWDLGKHSTSANSAHDGVHQPASTPGLTGQPQQQQFRRSSLDTLGSLHTTSPAEPPDAGDSVLDLGSVVRDVRRDEAANQVLREYKDVKNKVDAHPWGRYGRKLDLRMQYQLYRSVNYVAFRICQSQARPVYKSRRLMHAIFGTSLELPGQLLNYNFYSQKAIRLFMVQVLQVHWSNWAFILALLVLQAIRVKLVGHVNLTGSKEGSEGGDRGALVFVTGGALLVVFNIVIFVKAWWTLQAIVVQRVGDTAEWRHVRTVFPRVLGLIGEAVRELGEMEDVELRYDRELRNRSRARTAAAEADAQVRDGTDDAQHEAEEEELDLDLDKLADTVTDYDSDFSDEEFPDEEFPDEEFEHESESRIPQSLSDKRLWNQTESIACPQEANISRDASEARPSAGHAHATVANHGLVDEAGATISLESELKHFWRAKPELLVRLLQSCIFFTSIYLAFFFLMFAKQTGNSYGGMGAAIMVACPAIILLGITPVSLPVFVLLLDVIGTLGQDKLNAYEHMLRENVAEKKAVHAHLVQDSVASARAGAQHLLQAVQQLEHHAA